MKVVYTLFLFAVVGSFSTAYAQNISNDEVDVMIRELIRECQDRVMADEYTTEAEKTVAKRNCETDITNQYKNVEIDYKKSAEKGANQQNMQKCEDWYPQYRYLTQDQFRLQKHEATVTDCITLYHDSIWKYVGEDRLERLIARLLEIKAEAPEEPETRHVALNVNIPDLQSNILKTQQDTEVTDLEEKIRILEEELIKKDKISRHLETVLKLLISQLTLTPFYQPRSTLL